MAFISPTTLGPIAFADISSGLATATGWSGRGRQTIASEARSNAKASAVFGGPATPIIGALKARRCGALVGPRVAMAPTVATPGEAEGAKASASAAAATAREGRASRPGRGVIALRPTRGGRG